MASPAGRNLSGVEWQYRTVVLTTAGVEKPGAGGVAYGTGMKGALAACTPNVVGEYDLKHMISIRQADTWKGGLSDEKSDLFLTYSAPTQVAGFEFTVGHLERVCGWAQGTNALSGDANTARAVQLECAVPWLGEHLGPWNIIMNRTPADCYAQAEAMDVAVGLLGIGASVEQIQFLRTCPVDGPERHSFYMKPSASGPWNFHAICNVGSLSYSLSQSNRPFGTKAQMWESDGTGLVIDHFGPWWPDKSGYPVCTVDP